MLSREEVIQMDRYEAKQRRLEREQNAFQTVLTSYSLQISDGAVNFFKDDETNLYVVCDDEESHEPFYEEFETFKEAYRFFMIKHLGSANE